MKIHLVLSRSPSADEAAIMIAASARELGHEVSQSFSPGPGLNIVLSPHLRALEGLPPIVGSIGYTFEQHAPGSRWNVPPILQALRRNVCWAYDPVARSHLQSVNVSSELVQVGYSPAWETIPRSDEDIDVIFFGADIGRRREIVDGVRRLGLRVAWPSAFGRERDLLYARSKVCLSLASYSPSIFMSLRAGYLIANRKCVISEKFSSPSLYPYSNEIEMLPAGEIAGRCARLVADAQERSRSIEKAYCAFRQYPFKPNLERALKQLPETSSVAEAIALMKTGKTRRIAVAGPATPELLVFLYRHRQWKLRYDGTTTVLSSI